MSSFPAGPSPPRVDPGATATLVVKDTRAQACLEMSSVHARWVRVPTVTERRRLAPSA